MKFEEALQAMREGKVLLHGREEYTISTTLNAFMRRKRHARGNVGNWRQVITLPQYKIVSSDWQIVD